MGLAFHQLETIMGVRWLVLLGLLCLALAQESGEGSGEESGDEAGDAGSGEEGGDDAEAGAEAASEASGDGGGEEGGDAGDDEGCEVEETDGSGSGSGDDDIGDILALGGEEKKCKKKPKEGSGEGSGDEPSGADALAEAVGAQTCDKDGMDPKIAECLEGLETQVGDLMTAIMGPEGGGGTLEDKITLVLVKKGVISCENETQCDDNKQCLKQPDGMSRCQDPCERPEIIRCDVPFSECISEEHKPRCECKENFHGNGTDVCIPMGFETESNKRGYRMFDEEYVEWENATRMCQELGARLPVLSDKETINIVLKYLKEATFEVFEQWDSSSRRVWLGLQYHPGVGLTWVDGQRIVSYPISSRLFVWESKRLLSQEASYADSSRHYGLYINGDMAKLPGGGRRGAAVLCELIPDQLAEDPASQGHQAGYPQSPEGNTANSQSGYPSNNPGYPASPGGGYPGYPSPGYPAPGYPSPGYGNDDEYDGGYPSYPGWR